ncbi:hypothetical protein RJO15_08030 [Herbaspirillum huttiense F1]|uniref:hypothetical protein n=1 Tax=Herbaspirillum huttiense TaxID=863372 RepID=UPI00288476A8|nr:hypothetical protein [Herbaspirillum huttiense]MDT0355709.1 hypothetical protein [Herbaspirillum huttiense F1]
MIALLLKVWPWLVGVAGLIAGLFMRQQAKTTKAEAAQEVAETKQKTAEREAAAAQSGANSVQERTDVENTISAAPPGSSAAKLRDSWSRD